MKIKYAIYQGKVGLYAKEYFDKIDQEIFERRGVLGWRYIEQEDLPIVVNDAGGRCSFYPVEENFVGFVEVDEDQDEPLTREQCFPKNCSDFEFGWISPEGDTYNTGFEGHRRAADMICKELGITGYSAERELEEKGWVKISREAPYTPENAHKKFIYVKGLRLTKRQADALVDLGYSNEEHFRFLLEESERYW